MYCTTDNGSMRRPHPINTSRSASFETASDMGSDAKSSLGCRSPPTTGGGGGGGGGGAGGGSVYMVSNCLSEENRKYLPLGIQEIPDNGTDDHAQDESYWSSNNNINNPDEDNNNNKPSKRPYKRDAIDKSMASALKKGLERNDAVLSSLKLMGITAFIIDAQHAKTTPDIMDHVQRVITFVGKENRTFSPNVFQRCLLYQDRDGLLYNLVLPTYTAGLASKWQEYVDGFSSFQAILTLSILLRSLPCAEEGKLPPNATQL